MTVWVQNDAGVDERNGQNPNLELFRATASLAVGSKRKPRNGSTFNRPIGGNGRIHAKSRAFSFSAGPLVQPA